MLGSCSLRRLRCGKKDEEFVAVRDWGVSGGREAISSFGDGVQLARRRETHVGIGSHPLSVREVQRRHMTRQPRPHRANS